jgi:glutathione S-transferase
MILYDYILSASCYKIRLMAALLRVPLTLKAVNFHPEKEHKSDAMLALNPAGTLPVLVDGDHVMTETTQMLQHLAMQAGSDWLGTDAVPAWLEFAGQLNASLGMARLHDILSYEVDIEQARSNGVSQLRKLEEHLSEQRFDGMDFLTGARPTIADIACFPNTALAPDGGVSLDPYPAIRLWMRAIRSLPGFIEMPGIHRLHELAPDPKASA